MKVMRVGLMHVRSRMNIKPSIHTMPGRHMLGVHRPGRHCSHQAKSAMRYSAGSTSNELHPTKNLTRGRRSYGYLF